MPRPRQPPPVARQPGKRLIDLALAAPLLVMLAPLMLLIALLVRLDSPGPALFRQTRTGWRGAPFTILKFRTMRQAADCASPAITTDASGAPDSFQTRLRRIQTSGAAPGVTWSGRFLRASSLDELPQLLNVLRGEMSLVGPRPHMPELDALFRLRLAHISRRYAVRPGITGLAQISGARGPTPDVAAMAARLDADLAYVRAWSPWRDLAILLKTPWRLLDPRQPAAGNMGAGAFDAREFSAARRARTTHMALAPLHRGRMRRRARPCRTGPASRWRLSARAGRLT
ncbi:sugar transferase [Camelimonas sp. ID_303_24]